MSSPHSNRAHALLSASGAHRWVNCTPSARLEEEYGEKKTSTYAAEGTLAHELAELMLRQDVLEDITTKEFKQSFEAIANNDLFSAEMLDVLPIYTDYCRDQFIEAKASNPHAVIVLETKLDLTEFVPESFGTADCTIINDDIIEVIDLKYGKGVPVYADWNKQLMLYALGALRKYDTMYDIETVRMTIIQPRINNISSFVISVKDLLAWANEELRPAAEAAFNGTGELNAGEWCRFCAVKNQCRKLYEKQMELAKYEFAKAEMLTDEEIAEIILKVPSLIEWLNSIVEWAKKQAINNNKIWPGLKLVAGTSRRKWIADETKVAQTIFARFPELSEDEVFETKLTTITNMQKVVGKKAFDAMLSDLVIKPAGTPVLVGEDDKRPALGDQQAKIDFADE